MILFRTYKHASKIHSALIKILPAYHTLNRLCCKLLTAKFDIKINGQNGAPLHGHKPGNVVSIRQSPHQRHCGFAACNYSRALVYTSLYSLRLTGNEKVSRSQENGSLLIPSACCDSTNQLPYVSQHTSRHVAPFTETVINATAENNLV